MQDGNHHSWYEQTARDDSYICSGYWGNAAQGSSLIASVYDYLWAQHDSLNAKINRAFRMAEEAERAGGYIATSIIDDACCAFSTQLDIGSALLFDSFETLISLVEHDHITESGLD